MESLGIAGAWKFVAPAHRDERGLFREWFKAPDAAAALGYEFPLAQANLSISQRGVVRGIHFSIAPQGQAKWVTCASGAVWDVIVDVRAGSPTFGTWVAVELRAEAGDAVLIAPGLGHGFAAISEQATLAYLLSSPYAPDFEFGVHPLDPALAITWPTDAPILSQKDATAPNLADLPAHQQPIA